jgi:cytochrome c
MKALVAAAAVVLTPGLVCAQPSGDAAAGEEQFGRHCASCHTIADPTGEIFAGRNARTGPNLYGIFGSPPGQDAEFDYSDALIAYGASGALWEEANLVAYMLDPTGHLRAALDDPRARSKMAYRIRDEQDALDIAAYLATFSPVPASGGAAAPEGG